MRLTEEIEYFNLYWISGILPKDAMFRNEVHDPPVGGWSHVFLKRGEKKSLILCPYSLKAFWVSNKSAEIASLVDPREGDGSPLDMTPAVRQRITGRILDKWAEFQQKGTQADYNEAAIILKGLGMEVPTTVVDKTGEADTKSRGGKQATAILLKVVKESSKRGKFLQYFLDNDGMRSVRETMAEFGMTRSNALSYLFTLNKDHGIGYDLVGDGVTVILPDGCTNPFTEKPADPEAIAPGFVEAVANVDPENDEDDDSWLD
jgi:hypothetical protein